MLVVVMVVMVMVMSVAMMMMEIRSRLRNIVPCTVSVKPRRKASKRRPGAGLVRGKQDGV